MHLFFTAVLSLHLSSKTRSFSLLEQLHSASIMEKKKSETVAILGECGTLFQRFYVALLLPSILLENGGKNSEQPLILYVSTKKISTTKFLF